jgi:nucleotide-binding universal stress UspA family protein
VFRYAVSLARQHQARIILLHVIEPLGGTARSLVKNMMPEGQFDQLRQEGLGRLRQQVADRLQAFCRDELGESPEHADEIASIHIEEGDSAEVILQGVGRFGVDLIVMGTHGRRGLNKLLIGSVATRVVQRSSCPVMLVPFSEA